MDMDGAVLVGAMQPYALTLDRFIEHAAKWHGAAEVVTGAGGSVSARIGYSGLRDRSSRLSGALLSLGLARGDYLAVMAWNTQAHMECWYGAMGVGIVCHTLNPRLSHTHLAWRIQQAANRVLVVSPDLASSVEKLAPLCPTLEHVVVLDEPGAEVSLPHCDRVRTWLYGELLEERGADAPWGEFDDVSGLTSCDSVLVAVPMFHANGWGYPFAGAAVGAKLVLPGRHQDGASLANLINAEAVTVAADVATVWLGLVDYLDRTGAKVPSLRRVVLGGSSVPQALMDRLEERLEVIVQTCWGMTELSPLGTVTPPTAAVRKASQAGRPPIGVDLLVTDAKEVPLPRGHEGRLWGRPHEKWGECPILVVELRKGSHITDEGLLDAFRARVPNWWLPDAIVRVVAMPLATTGKIDKMRLRAEHR